jgi:hypothetical protein
MRKKLYLDIDGVLRDLNVLVQGGDPTEWSTRIGNQTFNEYVNDRLDVLFDSPPTIYFPTICDFIKDHDEVNVLTCQPDNWIPYTMRWIEFHFAEYGIKKYNVTYVPNIEEKENHIKANEIIIEDYPFFTKKMRNKVILVDRLYNQKSVNQLVRVYNPEQLRVELKKYVG